MQLRLEGGGGPGQPEGFQLSRAALRVLAQQHEVAHVGDQHQLVTVPVAAHLVAIRGQPGIVADGFDLDHAAFGKLPLALPASLHLLGGIESEVGMSGPLLCQLADAENLWLERAADGIQQIGQRRVVGPFTRCPARRADASQVGEVVLNRRREFLVRARHSPLVVPLRGHSLIPAQRQCYSIVRTPGTSKVSPTPPPADGRQVIG